MKKNIKTWLLAMTSIAPISMISVACTSKNVQPNKDDKNKLSNKDKNVDNKSKINDRNINSKFLEENINVLALGDSITAGFNGEYSFELPGNFNSEKDKDVSGLSYPSFLVELLQRTKPNFVKNYDNYALSGSKIIDWLYLLEEPSFDYDIQKKKTPFKFLLNLDQDAKNPFRNRIRNQFGGFEKSNLKNLNTKIKEADFITLSIGANDIFENIDLNLLRKVAQNPINENVNLFKNSLLKIYNDNIKNFDILLKRIKLLNPKAQIVVVGYPFIFLRAKPLLDELFNESNLRFEVFEKLNEINKTVAKSNDVVYVETYDEKYWVDNAKKLTRSIFDIHPTEEGYKKMAIELFRKLAFNYTSPREINVNQNQRYVEKDEETIHKIFDTGLTNYRLREIIANFESKKTMYQLKIENQKNELFSIDRNIIKNLILSNDALFGSILSKVFAKEKRFSKFFENPQFKEKIISAILRADLIDKIDLEIQKYFDETNLPINKQNLTNVFVDILFNKNIILDAFKEFIKTDFDDLEKVTLAELITSIAARVDLIDPRLATIKENKNITDFIENTVLEVLNNKNDYLKANSFLDILKTYFKNNPNISFRPLIKGLISNEYIFDKLFEQLEKVVPGITGSKKFVKRVFESLPDFRIFHKLETHLINKITSGKFSLDFNIFSDLEISRQDLFYLVKDFVSLIEDNHVKRDLRQLINTILVGFFSEYGVVIDDPSLISFKNSLINDFVDRIDEYEKELLLTFNNESNNKLSNSLKVLFKVYLQGYENERIARDFISDVSKDIAKNDKLMDIVVEGIQKALKLENFEPSSDNLKIKNLVRSVLGNVGDTTLFKNTLDDILSQLKVGKINFGSISEVATSINFSILVKELTNIPNLLNLFEGNKIKSEHVVEFLNLITEKSPLTKIENLSAEKNPLFYSLNNLDKFHINSSFTTDVKLIFNISLFSKLKVFIKPVIDKIANNENVEQNKKFLYRLSAIILYSAYEGYFKNSPGIVRNLFFYYTYSWPIPTVASLIFSAYDGQNNEALVKEILGNIYAKIERNNRDSETNISQNDLAKIIYYNNEKNEDGTLWREKLFQFIKKGKAE
ncbi:SGNH/GDSL hydrolase family protein [Mycoplasma phocoeninasale]|uniref:SGNH/GDSL hydrolase family protein n=1 Tax=Mycoplasma phocoeninasale TaxID=2726117 RepID=A0A858U6W2_9MOLU|nr:SGNH/GDSL hydrolase family protein [Mycoplasma phocoeninasale]QJG66528.1 SGNH/GDSL hydrolase family protein [Mycoplasma phocoeninasale]